MAFGYGTWLCVHDIHHLFYTHSEAFGGNWHCRGVESKVGKHVLLFQSHDFKVFHIFIMIVFHLSAIMHTQNPALRPLE
jgi:hypothetical protein